MLTLCKRLLLGVAVWCDFCVKWLLHFCKFLVNPNFDLEPDYFFRKLMNRSFQWCTVRMEYCQLFTHKSNRFLFKNVIQTSENKNPKTFPFLGACGPPSNTPIPRLTPLTTPNSIWIQSAILPQYTFQTDRHTDRLTDGISNRSVRRALTLYYLDGERCTNNIRSHFYPPV